MSGPKSGSYTVVSAEELRRRHVNAARASLDAALSEWEIASTAAAAYGVADTWRPRGQSSDDPAVLERLAAEARRRASELSAASGQVRAEQTQARLFETVFAGATIDENAAQRDRAEYAEALRRLATEPAQDTVPVPQSAATEWRETTATTVARIIARVRGDVTDAEREQVQQLASAAVAAGSADEAALAVNRLRSVQVAANGHALTRSRRAEDIAELQVRLAGVSGERAEEARRELNRALTDDSRSIGSLAQLVDGAVQAERSEADRVFALSSLRQVLEDLGYEPEVGFETAVAAGTATHAARDGWGNHSIRISAPKGSDRVVLRPVRYGDTPEAVAQDVDVEQEFCSDLGRAIAVLNGLGVKLDLDKRMAPGTAPVLVSPLAESPFTQSAPAARRAPQPQLRTLGRPGGRS